jgi:DNA polymerase I-like protein with 3'-5' exonuclease and polymerase domains
MKILTFDTETTTRNKGNPYDRTNRLVNIGWKCGNGAVFVDYPSDGRPSQRTSDAFNMADVVVGFNLKFDLAWTRRWLNITVQDHQRVYDCQLAWFILTNQQHRYPSLNQVAEYFGLGQKIDVIKEEYWSKGIDTPDIPRDVLDGYLIQDVELTYQVYQCLQEAMPASKKKLVQLAMMDLLVLHEMEWNGLLYDKEKSLELAEEENRKLADIDKKLLDIVGVEGINFGSGQQLSAILYGGTIVKEEKEDYLFTYKDPKKVPVIKQRKVERQFHLPRLVEPLPKTETKNETKTGETVYFTNEPTLKSLKAKGKAKQIIDLVLERAKIEKVVSSYYTGIPKLMTEMNWPENEVHGNLNQCTAVTGRLSSDKPNLQNLDKNGKKLFYSRYAE